MDRLIGVFLVVLSAACFGTNAIFARICYDAGANPATFLFIRFLIASPVMFLIMIARGFTIPRGKLLVSLTLIGGIGLAGTTLCFYTAIHLAPVNLVIIIAYMYPTIVTLLSAVFFRQPITGYKIAALLMTVVGISFTIGMDSGGYFLGIIFAIGTANVAIISTFEVVVAVALATIILGETLTLPKIFGGCLVISAVIILARSEYETARAKISHSISR